MADTPHNTFPSQGQFALNLADLNTDVSHEPRVSHRRLASALGFSAPHKLTHLIERHRNALMCLGEVSSTADVTTPKGGRPGRTFWLNKRQALYLCTKSETPRATEVTIQMVEVFDAHLSASLPRPDPDVAALNRVLQSEMPAGDFAFMRIGRRTVMLDTRRFRPGPGEEAVLLHPDGRIRLGTVQPGGDAGPGRMPRQALEKARRPRKGEPRATWVADVVQVIGVVIRPGMPAAVGDGAPAGPRGASPAVRGPTPRRRKRLLPAFVPPPAAWPGAAVLH